MRRALVATVVAALLLLSLAGVGEAAPLAKVRLSEVVRSVFYVPLYVAFSQGFFEEEGLEVKLSTAWGADKGAAALVSGTVDIGFFGPEAGIYVYTQGAANHFILFAELTARDGSFLVGRRPEPDFQWSSLKGKTVIGARPGGVPELCLEEAIRKSGLEPFKDVNIIRNIAYTATAGAFASGVGDYVALFEPTPSMMEKEGTGYVVASIGAAVGPTAYTAFHARADWVRNHPDLVQKFTNAIYRGMLWTQQHEPAELVKAIEKFFPQVDQEVLLRCVTRYQRIGAWQRTPVLSKESFYRLQEIMIAGGELPKRVPFEKLVTNEFAERAVAAITAP
ncbi:MAG: ABC transporter substrate-binding protein [Bacillota bacterium]|nr:ABC transporter substrate-binding protein [Bacillota bacterium]